VDDTNLGSINQVPEEGATGLSLARPLEPTGPVRALSDAAINGPAVGVGGRMDAVFISGGCFSGPRPSPGLLATDVDTNVEVMVDFVGQGVWCI
jgi:hypothetical protein